MRFDEETEGALDEYVEEMTEARREENVILYEGCTVVTAPTGAPPEYITVMVDGVNDPNVAWRGVPPALGVGDEVLVVENPLSHRREIWGGSGAIGSSFPLGAAHEICKMNAAGTGAGFEPAVWAELVAPAGADMGHGHNDAAAGGQSIYDLVRLGLAAATELTIVGGVVTQAQAYHRIDTEGDAATDDLDTIVVGPGGLLAIRPENDARTVVVKHNTGNIWIPGGADITLDDINDAVFMLYDTALTKWLVIGWAGAAGGLGVHDHSTALLGGMALNPETLSSRCYVAGPGCPNTTVGAAVVDVLAAGPPALGSEYIIFVLGRTTEAADVNVPDYCDVVGVGTPTIDMGANTLNLGQNGSSLQNVVVTSSDPAGVVVITNAVGHVLWHIRIVSAGADCLTIHGTSDVTIEHVILERGTSGTGFNAGNDVVVRMKDCQATGPNMNTALSMVDNALVYSYDCVFEGVNDDVATSALTVWCHASCRFDRGNVSITGVEVPLPQSQVNLDGTADAVILDADGDTTIGSPIDDVAEHKAGGLVAARLVSGGWTSLTFATYTRNNSGAATSANKVGYIGPDGLFYTTTTANLMANWCVVVYASPGNDGDGDADDDIWVANRGYVTIEMNENCAVGNFLATSTIAGRAQRTTATDGATGISYGVPIPEMFAICREANAAGAGGTCKALLLCDTKFVAVTSATRILYVVNCATSDFRTTINGAPVGAVVTYTDPPISGAENTIDPQANNYLGKFRLYNENDVDYALIDDVDTAANQITLTANAPAGWANGEIITTRSQTAIHIPHAYDIDLSDSDNTVIPVTARAIHTSCNFVDNAGVPQYFRLHPWETWAYSKQGALIPAQIAGTWMWGAGTVPLRQQRFVVVWSASGANTASWALDLLGYWEAIP